MQGTNFIGQDSKFIFGLKPANDSVVQPQDHAAPSDHLQQEGSIQRIFVTPASEQQSEQIHDLLFANENNYSALISPEGLQVGNVNISMQVAEGAAASYSEIKRNSIEWCLLELPSDNQDGNNDQVKYQLTRREAVKNAFNEGYRFSNLNADMIVQSDRMLKVLEPLSHTTVDQQPVATSTVPHKLQVQAAAQAAAQVVAHMVQVASRAAAPAA